MGLEKMTTKTTSLRKVKWNRIHGLEFDNKSYADFWFLLDGDDVVLAEQPNGSQVKQKIRIPRRAFNHFVDSYLKEQKVKKPDLS